MITIAWIGIISAILILVVVGIWLLRPYDIADAKQPFEVLNKHNTVNINTPLVMKVTVNKKLPFTPVTNPVIRCESGNLVTLASYVPTDLPLGENTIISDRLVLPPKFQVGDRCQYVVVQTYQVNPIRQISETYVSEFFTVGEPIK